MAQNIVTLRVYKGRKNSVALTVKQLVNGSLADVPFDSVARMVLQLNPNSVPVEVDSQDNPSAIDFSTDGQVLFDIGQLAQVTNMSEGYYDARLTAIDSLGNPTELVNEDHPINKAVFAILDTTTY